MKKFNYDAPLPEVIGVVEEDAKGELAITEQRKRSLNKTLSKMLMFSGKLTIDEEVIWRLRNQVSRREEPKDHKTQYGNTHLTHDQLFDSATRKINEAIRDGKINADTLENMKRTLAR